MNKLYLNLLGDFQLHHNTGTVIKVSSKKARALLGCLAARPGKLISRSELARILWERHDEQQALTNLRQTLSVLNKKLGTGYPNWLSKESGYLALSNEVVETDIGQLQNQLPLKSSTDLEQLTQIFRGPFLDGLNFHEETLNQWIVDQRQYYHLQQIEVLKRILLQRIKGQDSQGIIDTGEKLVSLNPIDEESHRQLMSAYSALGQQHRVLRQYQQCCQALDACQLGAPQEQTSSLFESLYHQTVIQSAFKTKNESLNIHIDEEETPAIAVLPFKEFAVETLPYSLGTALTEEIVTELRRFQGFKVISALSSLALKPRETDLSAAGILGARYLISGTIRQFNQQVQVGVELVDASNGELIWSEKYMRAIDDLFVLQVELARDIAGSIEPETAGHACLLSSRKPASSMTAWDLVLQGNHQLFLQIGTQWDSNRTRLLYQKAMEIDPDYAPAYAGYAYSLCLDLKEDIAVNRKAVEHKMKELAQHAVRLDHNNPWCKVVLGRTYHQLNEYDAAIKTYRKAVELCPSSSKAYFGLGFGLSATGQYEEAISAMDRAHRLSPRDPINWVFHTVKGLAYMYAERFELAQKSASLSSCDPSANHWASLIQASSMVHIGRYDDAMKVLENVRKTRPTLTARTVENAFPVNDKVNPDSIREGLVEAGLPSG